MTQPIIAIAGATGFVGTAIRNSLVQDYEVRGLTRSVFKMTHHDPDDPVSWIHCDAYALDSVTSALGRSERPDLFDPLHGSIVTLDSSFLSGSRSSDCGQFCQSCESCRDQTDHLCRWVDAC